MNIKLDQLKSFLLVAEESNLTRAAARRHSTPSAVSEHIRNLEAELGLALFERSKQGMALTGAGERLLIPVSRVFSSVEGVRNTALSILETPKADLSIGLNSPPEYLRMDRILKQKAADLPYVNLEMRTRSSPLVVEEVLSGKLDLGYVFGEWDDPRLHIVPLSPIKVSVIGPNDYSLDSLPESFEDRQQLPWVWPNPQCPFASFMKEILGPESQASDAVITSDDEYSTVVMVKTGLGFGLVEHNYGVDLRGNDAFRMFDEPHLSTNVSLICGSEAYRNGSVTALFDLIVQQWQCPSD
ncbi:LysR family transcriptional regulator [Marinobacter confluentis]|uniref:LysR family transcriptional regulator n=1 Tax=Marinobacter confluentis TaxID=1697557 RepID=A0A4Z1C6X7_9GAMM|nr:LysR family transcriptional regulator [Marinobacter confluentis]TGN39115.1 LysR family transcriptional regulator [Marinobacter confluentis]